MKRFFNFMSMPYNKAHLIGSFVVMLCILYLWQEKTIFSFVGFIVCFMIFLFVECFIIVLLNMCYKKDIYKYLENKLTLYDIKDIIDNNFNLFEPERKDGHFTPDYGEKLSEQTYKICQFALKYNSSFYGDDNIQRKYHQIVSIIDSN